jgi:hypothetical protein
MVLVVQRQGLGLISTWCWKYRGGRPLTMTALLCSLADRGAPPLPPLWRAGSRL